MLVILANIAYVIFTIKRSRKAKKSQKERMERLEQEQQMLVRNRNISRYAQTSALLKLDDVTICGQSLSKVLKDIHAKERLLIENIGIAQEL